MGAVPTTLQTLSKANLDNLDSSFKGAMNLLPPRPHVFTHRLGFPMWPMRPSGHLQHKTLPEVDFARMLAAARGAEQEQSLARRFASKEEAPIRGDRGEHWKGCTWFRGLSTSMIWVRSTRSATLEVVTCNPLTVVGRPLRDKGHTML